MPWPFDGRRPLESDRLLASNQVPAVQAAIKYLGDHPRVKMLNAIGYLETTHILNHARFVVTDSGGIQEEASTLNRPVVICRKTTEKNGSS